MSADSSIAEALARIEHKVDVALMLAMKLMNLTTGRTHVDLPAVGDPNHLCPLCGQVPQYLLEVFAAIVFRKCGCGTGKVAIDLKALAPPTLNTTRSQYAGADGAIDQPEDGGATGGGPRIPQPGGHSSR